MQRKSGGEDELEIDLLLLYYRQSRTRGGLTMAMFALGLAFGLVISAMSGWFIFHHRPEDLEPPDHY